MLLTLLWAAVVVAAIGVIGSFAFFALSGQPVDEETAERIAAQDPELRRQTSRLSNRPLWRFDLGLVVGMTTVVAGTWAAAPLRAPFHAVGLFLTLASLTGRLLVMGGRRRLLQIQRPEG